MPLPKVTHDPLIFAVGHSDFGADRSCAALIHKLCWQFKHILHILLIYRSVPCPNFPTAAMRISKVYNKYERLLLLLLALLEFVVWEDGVWSLHIAPRCLWLLFEMLSVFVRWPFGFLVREF